MYNLYNQLPIAIRYLFVIRVWMGEDAYYIKIELINTEDAGIIIGVNYVTEIPTYILYIRIQCIDCIGT